MIPIAMSLLADQETEAACPAVVSGRVSQEAEAERAAVPSG